MPVLASCPIFSQNLGMDVAQYPLERKDRADPSLTPGSIFQVIRKLIFNPSPLVAPTPSLTTTLFKSDKPSVVKSFLFAIPGSGETLCSLFPWAFDVLNRTGIFLPKTSHSGRFWLVFGHWTNPGISPRVKSTWAQLWHFLVLFWNVSNFYWRLGKLKYFQLASKFFIEEKNWLKNLMAAPNLNNRLKREQSSTLNWAAQGDSVQFSTEQGLWHSFPWGGESSKPPRPHHDLRNVLRPWPW